MIRRISVALVLVLSIASLALAVDGNPAPQPSNAFPFVGRVRQESIRADVNLCTSSLIRASVALSAAHCINASDLTRGFDDEQHFERFRFATGSSYFALGVRHPNFNAATSANDIALVLVLNGPSAPLGTLMAAADPVAMGDSVQFLGFARVNDDGAPLLGMSSVSRIGALDYGYNGMPHFIEPGDSGGPALKNFGTPANPNWKIISAHSREAQAPGWTGAAVQPLRAFINGDGSVQKAVLTRLAGQNNGDWNTAALWRRGSAGAQAVPAVDDVAILDPTTGPDPGTTITIGNQGTQNLEGLITDVTLSVAAGGALNVGSVAGQNKTGFSGGLNGGVLNVSGDAKFGFSLENEGDLNVNAGGTITLGAKLSTFIFQTTETALFNGKRGTAVVRGNLAVQTAMTNRHVFRIEDRGVATVGAELPMLVGQNVPYAIRNGDPDGSVVEFRVNAGGRLSLTNGNQNLTAAFLNTEISFFFVEGSAAGQARADVDLVINKAVVQVSSNGTLTAARRVQNYPNAGMLIQGDDNGRGVVNSGILQNFRPEVQGDPGGFILVRRAGELNASFPANAPGITNQPAFQNETNANINVEGGGSIKVMGQARNQGTIRLSGSRQTPATMRIEPGGGQNPREFKSDGRVFFVPASDDGGGDPPFINLADSDFINIGPIQGEGWFVFNGESSFSDQAYIGVTPDINLNQVSVFFDGARTATDGPVTMETTSIDRGPDPGALQTPFALFRLCIFDQSNVQLVDDYVNEDGSAPEVLYVANLGVQADSTLDLNGKTLYYQTSDCTCGDLSGNITGGNLIQLP